MLIQAMVEVGAHILTAAHGIRVNDYTEVIDRLVDVGVLRPETGRRLRPMPGLRNILVHEYIGVDYGIVVQVLGQLERFRDFIDQVES